MAGQEDVDELFGGGAPRPRTLAVLGFLVPGVILSLLGVLCTSAPGGVLVLIAWTLVEKDLDRIEAGYLPAEDRGVVTALLRLTQLALALVILLFVLESFLLCQGVYPALWGAALEVFVMMFAGA